MLKSVSRWYLCHLLNPVVEIKISGGGIAGNTISTGGQRYMIGEQTLTRWIYKRLNLTPNSVRKTNDSQWNRNPDLASLLNSTVYRLTDNDPNFSVFCSPFSVIRSYLDFPQHCGEQQSGVSITSLPLTMTAAAGKLSRHDKCALKLQRDISCLIWLNVERSFQLCLI